MIASMTSMTENMMVEVEVEVTIKEGVGGYYNQGRGRGRGYYNCVVIIIGTNPSKTSCHIAVYKGREKSAVHMWWSYEATGC